MWLALNNSWLWLAGEAWGDRGNRWEQQVMVLSYPAYCRYRSALKRLERCEAQYMKQAVVLAIGGRPAPSPNTRVVFCKDTFDYPELEDHQLLCNHLGQWMGGFGWWWLVGWWGVLGCSNGLIGAFGLCICGLQLPSGRGARGKCGRSAATRPDPSRTSPSRPSAPSLHPRG